MFVSKTSVILAYTAVVGTVNSQCWQDVACTGPSEPAFSGPWETSIFASRSRTVSPSAVLTWPSLAKQDVSIIQTISGNGSLLTYDFGKEVGGSISFDWHSTGDGELGVAFTEAKNFVGARSDDSNGAFKAGDGALVTRVTAGTGSWSLPDENLRGGFRYMTVFVVSDATPSQDINLTFSNVSSVLDFQPTWPNLQAYQGYFHSSDELLNRVWYAGAYTLQSNMVPTDTGRAVPFIQSGWANNASLGPGDTIIVDGAKRDRAVWPGDMGVAVPSTFVSVGDLDAVKNALQVMYDTQNKTTGAFAESGPPLSQLGSDTYHMWSMIGTYNYFLYTNDTTFLRQNWPSYQLAMSYVLGKVLPDVGLLNVTGLRDWARRGQGGTNTEANMILHHALVTGSQLSNWLNDPALATNWSTSASNLATAINTLLYDPAYGAYKDNNTATPLHPQDANALSLYFSVAPTNETASIESHLTENWTPIGPVTPELPDNISPFITSFELLGRLQQNDTTGALDLLRTTWGWIINNPNSTESTLLEGYLANGSFSYRNYQGYSYDESYVSHAHGWSAGPTSALTNYILGLDVVEPAGQEWRLAPQVGDLTHVEGGFTTRLGKFSASWNATADGFEMAWEVPAGTSGSVVLPMGMEGTVMMGENAADVSAVDVGLEGGKLSVGGGRGFVSMR